MLLVLDFNKCCSPATDQSVPEILCVGYYSLRWAKITMIKQPCPTPFMTSTKISHWSTAKATYLTTNLPQSRTIVLIMTMLWSQNKIHTYLTHMCFYVTEYFSGKKENMKYWQLSPPIQKKNQFHFKDFKAWWITHHRYMI